MKALPRLSDCPRIAVDIETYDPHLKERGAGVRDSGHIVGLAIATKDNKWYFPFKHMEGSREYANQYAEDDVRAWAQEELTRTGQPKIFANGIYDLDYLANWGVDVAGPFYDIQNAEPLLDENRRTYSLDSLAERYLGVGKYEQELEDYTREHFGRRARVKDNLWRMPPHVVQKYAEMDARLTLDVFEKQETRLRDEGLWRLFELETGLVPMLLAMKRRGVRVNTSKADDLGRSFETRLKVLEYELEELAEFEVNVNASASIAKACDNLNLEYPFTETGKASFTKAWMRKQSHDLFKLILEIRKYGKFKDTFINSAIKKHAIHDRIHCQFNQLRGDEYGTVSGRFSSSHPNLQQIPSRDGELAKKIRALFIPDEGDTWYKLDYSSIEPRVSLHYASDKRRNYGGASTACRRLVEQPGLDVYRPMIDALPDMPRSLIKAIYLGIGYSMGAETLATTLGVSMEESTRLRNQFNRKVPYLKALSDEFRHTAQKTGIVTTLLGRIRHFDMFESRNGEEGLIKGEEEAAKHFTHKNIKRALCYKAFNSIIQGSSADIMKKAMLDVWESGVCNILGAPLLTVHDELDFSVPKTKEGVQAIQEAKRLMENTIKLRVPLIVDMEHGPNWGEVK